MERRHESRSAFSTLERAALDYTVGMTVTPVAVTDEMVDELRKHLDPPALVELTAVIAWENLRARFNHAFGIEAQGFSEGAYCPLPEPRER